MPSSAQLVVVVVVVVIVGVVLFVVLEDLVDLVHLVLVVAAAIFVGLTYVDNAAINLLQRKDFDIIKTSPNFCTSVAKEDIICPYFVLFILFF